MSRSSLGWAPPVRTKLWYLRNIDFLQGMTEEQTAMVEKRTVMREVRRREVFYLPGEASDRIYLLKRGVVKISTFVEGREVILALLKRGEVFGEDMASLIGMTRESVNMSLAEFREQGLVELQGRALRLLRPDALRAVR